MQVHAGYYGVMIWVLVILEHWFRHNVEAMAAEQPWMKPRRVGRLMLNIATSTEKTATS